VSWPDCASQASSEGGVAMKVMGVSRAGGVTGTVTLAGAHSAGKGGRAPSCCEHTRLG
jgi:L-serine deaminase